MPEARFPFVEQIVEQKLFSIITPVYNCGGKIETTINSVWWQERDLFEHIIVDGKSTDETLSTIEKYRSGIKLISEPDRGIYDAMNKGIGLASGKYLHFLGAGDRLRPFVLKTIAHLMPREELTFVYGNVLWEDQDKIYDGQFSKARMQHDNICHQAIFYERKIFEVLGNFELRFNVYADYVLNIKCFGTDTIKKKYLDCVIATYEGGGMSMHHTDQSFFEERAELIKSYLEP